MRAMHDVGVRVVFTFETDPPVKLDIPTVAGLVSLSLPALHSMTGEEAAHAVCGELKRALASGDVYEQCRQGLGALIEAAAVAVRR